LFSGTPELLRRTPELPGHTPELLHRTPELPRCAPESFRRGKKRKKPRFFAVLFKKRPVFTFNGKTATEDLPGSIFSRFCIGK
jgi:hypothetical protein